MLGSKEDVSGQLNVLHNDELNDVYQFRDVARILGGCGNVGMQLGKGKQELLAKIWLGNEFKERDDNINADLREQVVRMGE